MTRICAHCIVAILPCNDLDASEAFYARLGFSREKDYGDYRILDDGLGAQLHLNPAPEGWVVPPRNPFGLYFYAENVDDLARRMGCTAEDKPWGMHEFALSDPDGTLVRVGWPLDVRTVDVVRGA